LVHRRGRKVDRAWWRRSGLSVWPSLVSVSGNLRRIDAADESIRVTLHSALPERNHVLRRNRDHANLGAIRHGLGAPSLSHRSKCSRGEQAWRFAARGALEDTTGIHAIARQPPEALVVMSDAALYDLREPISALALKQRLPTIAYVPEFTDAGA